MSSKRIRNKNLKLLSGKSLIEHTILHALDSKFSSQIYISTDSSHIENICNKYPVNVIKRPKKISHDFSSSEDTLLHTLNLFKEKINMTQNILFFYNVLHRLEKRMTLIRHITKSLTKIQIHLLSVTESKKFLWSKIIRVLIKQ